MEFLPYEYKFGEIVKSYKLVLVCYHEIYGTKEAEYIGVVKSVCKEFFNMPFLSEDHGVFPMMALGVPKLVLYKNGKPIFVVLGYKVKSLRRRLIKFFEGGIFSKENIGHYIPDYSVKEDEIEHPFS